MKKTLLPLLIITAAGCDGNQHRVLETFACEGLNEGLLAASYTISDNHLPGERAQRNFQLIRQNTHEVLHITGQNAISEKWNKLANGSARPVRYFDRDQRAIEYQPEDISATTGATNWQAKYQLLTEPALASYELKKTSGQGCKQVQEYHAQQDGVALSLAWLPQLKLILNYAITGPEGEIQWQLTSVTNDREAIEQSFASRETYISTDFADIGDNESDPFLLQMINLGFIEHGASGFYNAQGDDIGGGHAHSHAH